MDFSKHRDLLKESISSIKELKSQNKLLQEIAKNRSIAQEQSKYLTINGKKFDEQSLSSCLFSSPERKEFEHAFNTKLEKDKNIGDIIADFDKKRQKQLENMEKIEKNLENLKRNKNESDEVLFKENDRRLDNIADYEVNKKRREKKKEITRPKVREKKVQQEITEIDEEIKSLVFKIKDAVHSKPIK